MKLLAQHYEHLALAKGEFPVDIYIPVIEDTRENRFSRFRAVLDVDEEMPISRIVFFEYWGLKYSTGEARVYDVVRELLIDEEFMSRKVYWQQWTKHWKELNNKN